MKSLAQLKKELRMSSLDGTASYNYVGIMEDMVKKYYEGKDMVEIGSFEGGSTELFAMFCSSVVSIDPYENGNNVKQDGGKNVLSQARKAFSKRMTEYQNVRQIRVTSTEAAKEFKSKSLDAIYIDANHNYDAVVTDIKLWFPKVKIGGIIGGHDFYEAPKDAILDILGEPHETFQDASWVFIKTKDLKLKKISKRS